MNTSRETELTQRRSTLSAEKRALLEKRLRGEAAGDREKAVAVTPLPRLVPAPAERYTPFPLRDMQRLYWLGRRSPEAGGVSAYFYLETERTDLDLARFQRAWQRLVERHDMLRAIIRPDGRQQILPQVPPYEMTVLDLTREEPAVRERALAGIRERMSTQVRPAERWPLFEIRATRLDEHCTRLHFGFDLLLLDLASIEFLADQWARLYDRPESGLAPLEISFRDYVLTEQAFCQSDLYTRSLDYWQKRLPTLPLPPPLPRARQPAALQTLLFTHREGRLEPAAWQAIKQRAKAEGLTPSLVVLTVFADILTQWSGNAHFLIQSTLFQRLPFHPRINEVMGQFTSMILLEVDNRAGDTLLARGQRLEKQLWKDLEHSYVNGAQLLQEFTPGMSTASIVFTSALAHFEEFTAEGHIPPLAWLGKPIYSITQQPQAGLEHMVAENAGALEFHWVAAEGLFAPGLIEPMFSAYCKCLHRLAEDTDSWFAGIPGSIAGTVG
ncbi:MAG: condensation domain-containing protein [Candidatus Competibacteraceae bacterium]